MENGNKKKNTAGRNVLAFFGVLLVAIIIAVAIYVAFFPTQILPQSMNKMVFPMETEDMGKALPKGSMAIAEKLLEPHRGDVAAFYDQDTIVAARVTAESELEYSLAIDNGDAKYKVPRKEILGTVTFYAENLGYVVSVLHVYRLFVAAAGIILLLVVVAFAATSGVRKRKREKRKLLAKFEYYGEKYDEEESGIDY